MINTITYSLRDSLDELFAQVDLGKLPSLPHVLVKLLDFTFTEQASFDELSGLIKQDTALTSRVVSAASTAYYAGQGKSLDFERTLVLLGLDTIKTISITASVQQFFSRFDNASSRRLKGFWRSSLSCALFAKQLAHVVGYEHPEESYLAGLMHNVGVLIFEGHYKQEFEEICSLANSTAEQVALEQERIGANRYQAGAWLIGSWELDSFMEDAVLFQSEPLEQIKESHPLVKIVYLANLLSQSHLTIEDEGFLAAQQLFDLDRELLESWLVEISNEVSQAANSLGIDIGEAEGKEQSEADSDQQLIELADRVRNLSLIGGVKQQLSAVGAQDQAIAKLKQSLHILFGLDTSLFLLLDETGLELVPKLAATDNSQLSSLSVPAQGNSLLAAALSSKQVEASFSGERTPAVIDKQLAKALDADCLVCLPLTDAQGTLGIWVIALPAESKNKFATQQRLFSLLAGEASRVLRDVTELEQQQQDQHQDDRAFYEGRAREIVHEVNNPISIVKNYVHLLSQKLGEEHAAQQDLDIIREELDRAGGILLRLPGITDQPKGDAGEELVNVNDVVNDLLRVFRGSLFVTHNVEALTDLDKEMVAVAADRNAIKQILTNLIKNAAEALPEGGRITVATQGLVNHNGKSYLEVVIADNGPGIPVDIQERLFTPVETTKGDGHAGLGLAIVKNLMADMGGSISCRSNSRDGTRFELLLPRKVGNKS